MHQIQLTNEVYLNLIEAAAARGYGKVEDYLAEIAREAIDPDNFDHAVYFEAVG